MANDQESKSPAPLTISFREALALTGLSRNTLYKLVKANKVPGAQKLGGWIRFHVGLLHEWLECRT
jgi:excisionase family DNA binding protein